VAGYGAPAKATTLLNYCGFGREHISFIVDTTTAKQGRYVPGTGIPIVAPEVDKLYDDVGTFMLLAWNYAAEIMRSHHTFTADGGRWLVPFAAPVLL
jgi:hypothetical protein